MEDVSLLCGSHDTECEFCSEHASVQIETSTNEKIYLCKNCTVSDWTRR